jgi:hypothetical protein
MYVYNHINPHSIHRGIICETYWKALGGGDELVKLSGRKCRIALDIDSSILIFMKKFVN